MRTLKQPLAPVVPSIPNAHGSDSDGQPEERKYVARQLKLGDALTGTKGVEGLIGLEWPELWEGIRANFDSDHLKAMTHEIKQLKSEKDLANWMYIIEGRARDSASIPAHVHEEMRVKKYHGGAFEPEDYDYEHDNMKLQNFVDHSHSQIAGLRPWHVAALRFYTTSSFRRINEPLRGEVRPHPIPLTVYFLCDGIRKLRAVAAKNNPREFIQGTVLFRGMSEVDMDLDSLMEHGGTELAPMSTTKDRGVAEKYAGGRDAILFQYSCRDLAIGVSLQFLSVYPKESEYLYPPGTHLHFDGCQIEGHRNVVFLSPAMP